LEPSFASFCHHAGEPSVGCYNLARQSTVHFDRHRESWMSPEAKKAKALLYVTDGADNDAYVYTYLKGKLIGTLTFRYSPNGMSVDRKGDVFVTGNY
jgi:hypothetical protein